MVIFNSAVNTFLLRPPFAAFAAFQSPPGRGRSDVPVPALTLQPTVSPDSAHDDDSLITRLASGDEGAAAELYDRFAPTLMAVAFRITRSRADAEDVLLETLEQAWRQAKRYEHSRGSLEAWLAVIARSRAFDRIRMDQRRARRIVPIDDQPGGVLLEARAQEIPATEVAAASDTRRRVSEALATLPATQREAVELAFYDGLSHSEVAEKLGEPLGTIKTRIRLGMLKLRDMLLAFAPDTRA